MSGGGLISVAEALSRVLASVTEPLGEEATPLSEALGRTLAREIRALRTQPPFANSAMDGYALRAADAVSASARLEVVGEAAAGHAFEGRLAAGQATRIFTGAPLPEGADAVAIQEQARRDGAAVILAESVAPGDNVRTSGADFGEGEVLLRAGQRLTPRDIALAASANHPTLPLRRRPRVAILATGDELAAPGETPGPAQIIASNSFAVAGIVAAAGGEAIDLGIAVDDPAVLSRRVAQAQEAKADVLVTLGGASVGDYDLVQKTLVGAGMELGFWRIAMRPGKPLIHGRLASTHVLGLPGNPTSSTVCTLLFLRPLLRALVGDPDAGADPSEPARFAVPVSANAVRQDYMRVTLTQDDGGVFLATPIASQDSSLIKGLARADALVVRAPHAPAAQAGEACRIIRFAPLGA